MIVTSYYSHYLWIFFYFFFFLMIVAIAFDMKAEAAGGNGNDKNLISFLNVLFCFMFSCMSLTMQNYASSSMMGVNNLMFDSKKWLKKYVRLKSKQFTKVTSKHHMVSLMFINAFSNLVSLMPIYVIGMLILCNVWTNVETKIFKKEFFCVAVLGKHMAWYLTLFMSSFSMFFGKSRLHVLV